MPSSSGVPSGAEDAQKLKEAQLKIGMALKNAQYALTTHAHRGLTTALQENVNALTALSTYLSLAGSAVKAAAIAGQMAKILKSVATYVAAKERGGGGSTTTHAGESRHSSAPNTPASSSAILDEPNFRSGATRESAAQTAALQLALEDMTRQRDAMAEEKRALEAALEEARHHVSISAALTPTPSTDFGGDDHDAIVRRLRAEVDDLRREVRDEHMRAAALQDQLHEAEAQIEDKHDQVQALKSQLRISQEEKLGQDAAFAKKEEEIKALQDTLLQGAHTAAAEPRSTQQVPPAAGQAPRGYVDKDDFDALKLQNQLLQQALREQATKSRPTGSHTVLSQLTLEEIEADHQQQLEAMKLTIQEQYNRETGLLGKQRTMQETIDDLQRQLQLSSNRQWIQQQREKHLDEMEAAKIHIQQLQQKVEVQDQQIEEHQRQLAVCAESERQHADQLKNLKLHHETQIADLTTQLHDIQDQLHESQTATRALEDDLRNDRQAVQQKQVDADAAARAHDTAVTEFTQQLASSRHNHEAQVTDMQRTHAAQVAQLEQQLEAERDHAAANQSTVEEREAALQQRLAELRTTTAAEREQHEAQVTDMQRTHAAQVAQLEQQLEAERDHAAANQSTVEERETALQQRLAELRTTTAAEREQHEAQVTDMQRTHAAQVAQLEQQLEAERDHAAANQSTVEEREAALQQRLAELRTTTAAEREQHEAQVTDMQRTHAAQVAQLEQQLEAERDHAAANQSTVEEREAALQQRLAELRTTTAAERQRQEEKAAEWERERRALVDEGARVVEEERAKATASSLSVRGQEAALQKRVKDVEVEMRADKELHEAAVRELKERCDDAEARLSKTEAEGRRKAKEAEKSKKAAEEAHAAELQRVKEEHETALKRAQDEQVLALKRVRREVATKSAVATQPVDWLKDENAALKARVEEWEGKHAEAMREKLAAQTRVREAEQALAARKAEVRRLKDECTTTGETAAKAVGERDAAARKLEEASRLLSAAHANEARLETLRSELQEVQERLQVAEKDKALLATRYKRASAEKDECAEAARTLLKQYKEAAAARERLVAKVAAAEALVEEKTREAEELARAAADHADASTSMTASTEKRGGGGADARAEEDHARQQRIDELVTDLNAAAAEIERLKTELHKVSSRPPTNESRLPVNGPFGVPPPAADDALGSLAELRRRLIAMHTQLTPALYQQSQATRAHAAARGGDGASATAAEALQVLCTAMETAHTDTVAALEELQEAMWRLTHSANLQGVVYGKLLAALPQTHRSGASSLITPPPPPPVDVALARACTVLVTDARATALGGRGVGEGGRGGPPTDRANDAEPRQHRVSAPSVVRGRSPVRGKAEVPAATWSQPHVFHSAAAALSGSADGGYRSSSGVARTGSPARRRVDERDGATAWSEAVYGVQPVRAARLQRRSSFENFAVAQAHLSAAEERAGLRAAPTPPWK
ncbi:hypothetical protein NESM_000030100 [Novymonas esmeraldas]|uniref:Uncharacterized protein n=1 Tax=Novymonas esmeraldas TaxID=1808958 RepID=A0AAW0F3L2_9TRYP